MDKIILQAVKLLQEGKNVCIPTETVYGLAAIANNDKAVKNLFTIKNRPLNKALILHCYSIEQVFSYVEYSTKIELLGRHFWPGPLTLIGKLKQDTNVSTIGTSGQNTIAARIPNCEITLKILKNLRTPVFAPSANISALISPTKAEYVRKSFGPDLFIVKDDSATIIGLESTILDMNSCPPAILRAGSIFQDDIEKILNEPIIDKSATQDSPAFEVKQYSPNTRLKINVLPCNVKPDEAFLGFGEGCEVISLKSLNLSPSGNLLEAARNLYYMLYILDQSGASAICVAPIPNDEIGKVINARLNKAASK